MTTEPALPASSTLSLSQLNNFDFGSAISAGFQANNQNDRFGGLGKTDEAAAATVDRIDKYSGGAYSSYGASGGSGHSGLTGYGGGHSGYGSGHSGYGSSHSSYGNSKSDYGGYGSHGYGHNSFKLNLPLNTKIRVPDFKIRNPVPNLKIRNPFPDRPLRFGGNFNFNGIDRLQFRHGININLINK